MGCAQRTGEFASGFISAREVSVTTLDHGCDSRALAGLDTQSTCRHADGQHVGHLTSCLLQTDGHVAEGAENAVHVVGGGHPHVLRAAF